MIRIFIVSVVIGTSIYFFKRLKNYFRYYILLHKLSGPPSKGVFFGNVWDLQDRPERIFFFLRKYAKAYYPVYKMWCFNEIGVNTVCPEDCELILTNTAHNDKGKFYKLLDKWLRKGLLTSGGVKWQTRRKLLTPAFHFNILQEFISVFNEEAEQLVTILEKESEKSYIDISSHTTRFALKIISETAMGHKLNFQTKTDVEYRNALYEIGKILLYRIVHPWCVEEIGNLLSPYFFRERTVTKTLHKFTEEVIKEREKNFVASELPADEHDVYKGKKRLAMLDLLLHAKRNEGTIDDEGIHEEVDTFMFEGHDTVSSALGFLLMLLANNKMAQDRIVHEMGEVLIDIKKKPIYNDLQNLKYMERCIKESLRLYPSVHFITRTLGEDLKIHSGHLLPKDSHIAILIYDIHHNPDIYPDPEKFDPDRFLPENSLNRHPYAYLPFSAGPRNCIGQKFAMLEMKAVLCAILSSFILEPVDTPETITLKVDIVLRPKDKIKIKLVPRK